MAGVERLLLLPQREQDNGAAFQRVRNTMIKYGDDHGYDDYSGQSDDQADLGALIYGWTDAPTADEGQMTNWIFGRDGNGTRRDQPVLELAFSIDVTV